MRSCADGAEGRKVNILANKKTHSANFTVCSLCVLVLYDKILCKTTELEGGALPKFFGMEVMSMVYFSFQDLMSFGIFDRSIADVHFSEPKVKAYGHRKTAPIL